MLSLLRTHFSVISSKDIRMPTAFSKNKSACKQTDVSNGACKLIVPQVQPEYPAPWGLLVSHPPFLPHLCMVFLALPAQQSMGKQFKQHFRSDMGLCELSETGQDIMSSWYGGRLLGKDGCIFWAFKAAKPWHHKTRAIASAQQQYK